MFAMSKEKFSIFLFLIVLSSANSGSVEVVNSTILVKECGVDEICVRICCINQTCLEEGDFTDLSSLNESADLREGYKIVHGKPDCEELLQEEEEWKFLNVIKNLLRFFLFADKSLFT